MTVRSGTIFKNIFMPLVLIMFAGLLAANTVFTVDTFLFSKDQLKQAETNYGKAAYDRLIAWDELVSKNKNGSDREKLDKVNQFFNGRIRYASDIEIWGVEDYWATPVEFLVKGAGDCEDFSIAKYFTLKAMGLSDKKLRITYVKAIRFNIHHMVLTYYSSPDAEPLVLDNLVDSISPASKRTDLYPIFNFNGSGLWLAKQRGQGPAAGSSSRIRLWQDLLKRMSENKP